MQTLRNKVTREIDPFEFMLDAFIDNQQDFASYVEDRNTLYDETVNRNIFIKIWKGYQFVTKINKEGKPYKIVTKYVRLNDDSNDLPINKIQENGPEQSPSSRDI